MEPFVRDLLRGKYPSAYAAAWACEPEMERQRTEHRRRLWPRLPRSLRATTDRIIRLVHARNEVWSGAWWSEEEEAIIAPFARALAEGGSSDTITAARDCCRELSRQRRLRPEVPWLGQRDFSAVRAKLDELARQLGWRPGQPRWMPQERRLVEAYARALARGGYESSWAAAREYLAEVARLRSRFPKTEWLRARRTPMAVHYLMQRRSLELGRATPPDWSPEELRLLRRLARSVVQGRFGALAKAADVFIAEMDQNRRRPRAAGPAVPRSRNAVRAQLLKYARMRGRLRMYPPWSKDELEVASKYARELVAGRCPDAKHAAVEALKEIERLHRDNPNAPWATARRSLGKTSLRIARMAHRLGAAWQGTRWTADEDRIAEKYARAVVTGECESTADAAADCLKDLDLDRRRLRKEYPDALPSPQRRDYRAVRARIRALALAQRGVKLNQRWTPEEHQVARKWADDYLKTQGRRHARTFEEVAQDLQADLKRQGWDRRLESCALRLRVIVQGRIP